MVGGKQFCFKKAYLFWTERVAPQVLRSTSEQERYSCCKLAKFIASYLLLAAQVQISTLIALIAYIILLIRSSECISL